MTIFEGLNVQLIKPPATSGVNPAPSIFDGLNVMPVNQTEPEQYKGAFEGSWSEMAARTGKSAIAGAAGGLVDTLTSAYNIPAALNNATNKLRNNDDFEIDPVSGGIIQRDSRERPALPLIPSATEALDEGIDQITGDYTKTPEQEKWFQEGIKFASAVGSGGGLGSLAGKAGQKGAETALKVFGSTKPSALAGAAAAGAATQKAHEGAMSMPGSIGTGMGAGLATEAALTMLRPKNISRARLSITGFGKSNLDVPAIQSARNLNVDLPGVAATKGVVPAFAHQTMGKFPYFGDKLRDKIKTASHQYQKAWDTMLDSVGFQKTGDVSKSIDRSYDLMRNTIPEGAAALPTPILKAIADVESKLKTAVHSDPTKKLFSIMGEFKKAFIPLKSKLPEGFEKLPQNVQDKILGALASDASPVSVKELVRQKVELNKIMKDRNIFDRHDTDSLGFLHELKGGISKTLEDYGQTNPKFLNALKNADEKFAKVTKREALDDAFSGKIVDPKTGEVSYNSLLSVLGDRKQQKFLKNHLGNANYKKLEDFVNVAKAMESIKRNNPNPSGSATVGSVMGLITSIALGNITLPAKVIGGGAIATRLLTSKKFLNKATQFAKEPTEPLAKQLTAIVKENTGMTIQALQKGIRDNSQ